MNNPLPVLKLCTILLPPFLIGSAEYIRHELLLDYISMEAGNVWITLITLAITFLYAQWMFRKIAKTNVQLAEEQARHAVYEERDRLADELHDNIAQTLFFLNVKLQKGHINEAKSAVSEINSHLRQAIFNLRTTQDEVVAFPERIRHYLSEWSLVSGIDCDVSAEMPEHYLSVGEEVQLFGLIQEAFTNIRKHSGADKSELSLFVAGPDGWVLSISDNGAGLPGKAPSTFLPQGEKQEPPEYAGRYGLAMMHKRAEALGGYLDVYAPQSGGTRVIVRGLCQRKGRTG